MRVRILAFHGRGVHDFGGWSRSRSRSRRPRGPRQLTWFVLLPLRGFCLRHFRGVSLTPQQIEGDHLVDNCLTSASVIREPTGDALPMLRGFIEGIPQLARVAVL